MGGKAVNWMDVCIIILIILNGLRGLSIGLVLSVFSIVSYIAAGIIAKLYYPTLTNYILNNTNLIAKIQSFVFSKIKYSDVARSEVGANANIFDAMNLPKIIENLLMKSDAIKQYGEGVTNNIYNYISFAITQMIVEILSIIAIFLVVKFLINIAASILDGIASLPVINQFNRLGGFVFGIIKGVLIIFILFAIIVPAVSIFPSNFISIGLKNSILAKYFYDYNIILYMIKNFIVEYNRVNNVAGIFEFYRV